MMRYRIPPLSSPACLHRLQLDLQTVLNRRHKLRQPMSPCIQLRHVYQNELLYQQEHPCRFLLLLPPCCSHQSRRLRRNKARPPFRRRAFLRYSSRHRHRLRALRLPLLAQHCRHCMHQSRYPPQYRCRPITGRPSSDRSNQLITCH